MARRLLVASSAAALLWPALALAQPWPAAGPVAGTEPVPCVQGGAVKGCTPNSIAAIATATALQKSNNLSDVPNPAAARTALGVTATGADASYNLRANNLSDVASKPASLNTLSGLPHMANGAALQGLAHTAYPAVVRDGFAAAGDAPPLMFTAQAGACSLNSGNGDGGSQVKSSDGGCWIASFPGGRDAREWGAKCDSGAGGASDHDDAPINAALASLANASGSVLLPPSQCVVAAKLVVPNNVALDGLNSAALVPQAQNMNPMIEIAGSLAVVKNLYIGANHAGTNTAGTTISFDETTGSTVNNVIIEGPCIGIDMRGNTPTVLYTQINDMTGAGCGAIRIGQGETVATQSVDPFMFHVTAGGSASMASPPDWDVEILDAGGPELIHDDFLFGVKGLVVSPGANQEVEWLTCTGTAFDTNSSVGISIGPTNAGGTVKGANFTQCWTSNVGSISNGAEILLQNPSGGVLQGIHFVGQRAYNCGYACVQISAGADITIDNSAFCEFNSFGVYIAGASATNIAVRNNEIRGGVGGTGPSCDTLVAGTGPTTGIMLDSTGGAPTGLTITGNDLRSNTAPFSGIPGSGGASYIKGNLNVDDALPTVASAATINLNLVNPVWGISGSTAVTTMSGVWPNREVRLVETSGNALNLGPTGNICNAVTLPAYGSVLAVYIAGLVCWSMK